MPSRYRAEQKLFWLLPAAPLVCLLAMMIGPQGSLSSGDSLRMLLLWEPANTLDTDILFDVRFPRVITGFLVGAALSASGTALQAIARNPLVSPDIAGISSGAAFGAALALSGDWLPVQGAAFFFGLLAAVATYLLAKRNQRLSTIALVLAGLVVGAIHTALLALLQAFSDPLRLQSIVLWTLGNLHHTSWQSVSSLAIPLSLAACLLWRWRWRLNVIALGDDEAKSVGLDPVRHKRWILAAAVLAASASVAVAGVIAIVGLIVPHLARRLFGADHRRLLPAAALLGGIFVVAADTAARVIAPVELPVGIFTTLLGSPLLLVFLRSGNLHQRDD